MQANLTELIVESMSSRVDELREEFAASIAIVGVRHCAVDGLLPGEIAREIHAVFPPGEKMRLMQSFRETKYTSKEFDAFHPLLRQITFALQDPRVIDLVSQITGIQRQFADPSLYAGGLSRMEPSHFLHPHLDNSHDASRSYYRTLNLLYYVTPDWRLQNGGNLQLWDERVRENTTILSAFNRLVLMETTPRSWHSVNRVTAPSSRCCVSNYYFSPDSPTGEEYFNVTSFSAPPGQLLRRGFSQIDNTARNAIRKLFPKGIGKADIYRPAKAS